MEKTSEGPEADTAFQRSRSKIVERLAEANAFNEKKLGKFEIYRRIDDLNTIVLTFYLL